MAKMEIDYNVNKLENKPTVLNKGQEQEAFRLLGPFRLFTGHFRVVFSLCFKARSSPKLFK